MKFAELHLFEATTEGQMPHGHEITKVVDVGAGTKTDVENH